MNKIKVILVDDHTVVRDGIKALLKKNKEIIITGEASDSSELFCILKKNIPDVIIMDISLPDKSGIELTSEVKQRFPQINILILSMYNEVDFVFNSLEAGAIGYLPKNSTQQELIEAVVAVSKGQEFFSSDISNIILRSYLKNIKKDDKEQKKTVCLSKREIEILKLFVNGTGNQEIAEKLFISVRTVESHKNHIMQKLELKSTVDLIKYAIKNNIVQL
ncbi:MAG: response regulator transcription factor [Bacteroidales bacterium]|nr:response regulator transcription factor [Bacteroidales bacterium]